MKLFIALCLVAAVAADFREFKKKYGKKYKDCNETSIAKGHYNANIKAFDEHNALYKAGNVTYTVGINEFTDQDHAVAAVHKKCMNGPPASSRALPEQNPANFPPGAPSRDWSATMPGIRNQGSCGACWAFATVATMESLYTRNNHQYVMSPQYLIDCSRDGLNRGCDGGWPENAMNYILSTGMPLDSNYHYTGVQANCKSPHPPFVSPKLETQVNSYVLGGNDLELTNIVSQDGPVAAGVYLTPNFLKYSGGVFSDPACPSGCQVEHVVVVAGYGTDPVHGDYYLIRNSWGTGWGENGYMRMARGGQAKQLNTCSISCYAMYMKTQN